MRKTIFVLVLIVIAVILGGYYVAGVKAESQIQRLIALANRNPDLAIAIDSYKRGWFESNAVLNVKVHKPAQLELTEGKMQMAEARDFDFKTNVVIYHGPIIITPNKFALGLAYATTEFGLPQQLLEQFNSVFTPESTRPKVLGDLFINYSTSADVTVSVPAFTLVKKEGQNSVNWQGVVSNWYISSDLRRIAGDVDFQGMKFKQEQTEGNISHITIQYDVMQNVNNVWSGNASLELPSMEFLVNGQKKLQVVGLKISSDSKVNNDILNSGLLVNLEKVEANGTSYGPGQLDLAIRNLDAKSLGEIQQQLKSIDGANATTEQKQIMLMALLPKVSELIAKGAEIEINKLNVTMPQGDIKVTAKIGLPKGTNIANPMMIFSALQANANLQVPAALTQQALENIMQAKIKQTQAMQQQTTNQQALQPSANNPLAPTPQSVSTTDPAATLPVNNQKPPVLSDDEIAKMAAEQAQQRLNRLLAAGVLTQNGNLYNLVITFQGGKLTVNGKPFESSMLQ